MISQVQLLPQRYLEALLQASSDAIVLVSSEGLVLDWNPAAETLYGYRRAEALGRPFDSLVFEPNESPVEPSGSRCETVRRNRDGDRIDVAVTRLRLEQGQNLPPLLLDLSHDIRPRKQTERNLRLQNELTRALLEASSHEAGLAQALEAICRSLSWSVGEIWTIDSETGSMRLREAWHRPDPELAAFIEVGEQLLVPRGAGMPGRVWETGRPEWLPDILSDGTFIRLNSARKAGLKGAIALPLCHHGEFVGTVVFLHTHMPGPDERLKTILRTIGAYLAQSIAFQREVDERIRNERNCRAMFESAPLSMAFIDEFGRAVQYNRAFHHLLGRPPCKLMITEIFSLIHPEDRELSLSNFHALLSGEVATTVNEQRLLIEDAGERWVRITASCLQGHTGKPPIVLAMIEDITERKHAEFELARRQEALELANHKLRQQAERIETEVIRRTQQLEDVNHQLEQQAQELIHERNFMEGMIEFLPGTLIYLDSRLVIRRVNPNFSWRFGLTAGEVVGRSLLEIPEDLAETALKELRRILLPDLQQVLATQEPREVRHAGIGTDGDAAASYFDFRLTPVFDYQGRLTGMLVLGTEVSDRVRYLQLQREQIETLRQSDQLKTQFINTLSHEFKTPLTIITGSAEVIAQGMLGPVESAQLDYLGKIRMAAKSLMHLLSDLLDMSQIQAGKLMLVRRSVNLIQTLRQAHHLLDPLAIRRGVSIHLEVPDALPEVQADEQRLTQVILNLGGNAMKFTPEGGKVTLSLHHEGAYVCCRIRDTGVGIAEEDLNKLFESFVQLEAGQQAGGTGLGLAISKALVEAHGGTIGALSEPGNGSVFWFRVPLEG